MPLHGFPLAWTGLGQRRFGEAEEDRSPNGVKAKHFL